MKKPSSSAGQIISKAFSTNNALSRSLHWPSFPKWMRSWSFTTREVIGKAIMQLKVGKSPGINDISAEVYQYGREAVLNKLQNLFTNVGRKRLYRRTSEMQSLSLCTKTRVKNQTFQTSEALPYSPLHAKSLLASC